MSSNNGILASKNPDVFVKEYDSNEKILGEINEKCTEEVKYFNWKRVQDGEKLRWKEVEEKVSKTAFNDLFNKELELTAFRGHVQIVQTQYIEMRRLRENLKDGNIMIWMDFAENYNCSAVEEIQSAYWNTAMVSLHTMVVYFPEGHTKKLQSMVAVSDLVQHNATTVFTILKKTIPIVKEEYPEFTTVHYLTDSPTSQYRNRYVFQILANHEADFGIKGRWNNLEAGHGKDPCDGLGASVKRTADQAVKQGKCSIQGASDFYAWGMHCEESGSKVKYIFYDQNDYDSASAELLGRPQTNSIPGTMKLHAVVPSLVDSKVL
ncbi:unnamed protein product [Mytilus coruscus]|uniref:Uncharacterized protein n=1 Tax=Mytilus coruscus TaxID=42192 RepID=A0A6J8DBL3_MYTCO|nr:unnamed protein product [Mytilus coruscus]